MQNSSCYKNVRRITIILHLYYRSFRLVSSLQQLILYLFLLNVHSKAWDSHYIKSRNVKVILEWKKHKTEWIKFDERRY